MWELIFKHLPMFGLILGCTILGGSIFLGGKRSINKIFGYFEETEDKIIFISFMMGFFSILGGISWLFLVREDLVSENNIIVGLLIGGVVGGVVALITKSSEPEDAGWIVGTIVSVIAGGIAGVIVGGTVVESTDRIASGIAGVFVGAIVGVIVSVIVSVIVGEIADGIVGVIFGVIAGLIFGGIVGWIVGGIVGGIVGVIAGGWIAGTSISWFVGENAGGWIAGMISIVIYSISFLFSTPLTPILIFLSQHKIICSNCLRYSAPLKSKYSRGIRFCEHCEKSDRFIKGIRKVIGLICGDVVDSRVDGDKFYINLWDEKEKKARNADIDVLEIRNSPDITYDWAINDVVREIKNDILRPPNYLKKIPVILKDNPPVPVDAMKTLEKEFGGIK